MVNILIFLAQMAPHNKSLKSDQREVVTAFAKGAKAMTTSFGALAER